MDFLSNLHPHERDDHISFDEVPHIYTIDGDSDFMSVTTWIHSHFEHFDADAIITRMMRGNRWTQSKYYGKTPGEIKEGWEKTRDEAATAGTAMHLDIERFYNQVIVNNETQEYTHFLNFASQFLEVRPDVLPYRTEWMVWDTNLKFAGSIDMVYENPDGTLIIYDWKRSKEVNKTNGWGSSAHTECVNHIPDTNFWHYSLQLNTYKALLEKNYGKKVAELTLVILHPNNKSFRLINVPDLQQEVSDLFELRLKTLV
jgi:ATP-dependent exoDNAse (exonuclease V) beta subunit